MFSKFIQTAKNFIFPKFSELELIVLFYLILLLIFEYKDVIFKVVFSELLLKAPDYPTLILLGVFIIAPVFVVGYSVYKLIGYARHKEPMSFKDKRYFTGLFYAALTCVSLASILDISPYFASELIKTVELLFLFYILFRTLITGILTMVFTRVNMQEVYATQLTDKQTGTGIIVVAIVLSTVLYILLRQNHEIPSAVTLSYFYITILVLFYRKYFSKLIILK